MSVRKCQCFDWKLFVSEFNASANGIESLHETFKLSYTLNISIDISTISLSIQSYLWNARTRVRLMFSSDDQTTCEACIFRYVYGFDDIKFDVDVRVW